MTDQTRLYFRVNRRDLVYLKFILEAYEGMSTLSTIDRLGMIVQLTIPSEFSTDMQMLLETLAAEVQLTEMPSPQEWIGYQA
jgi:hypothetical protein